VSPEVVCEVSVQNKPQIIYYIILIMPIFGGSRNTAVFMHVSLNANELLLPAPFPEQDCDFTAGNADTLLKKHVWF